MISTSQDSHTALRPSRTERPVLLIVPPFQGISCPALGVSQIKSKLLDEGIRAEVLYLNLLFAERITPHALLWLSGTGKFLLGEFVFSCVLHDRPDEDIRRYVDDVLAGSELEGVLLEQIPGENPFEVIRYLVKEAREFIRGEAIDAILERDPWMVGLSSIFQSNCCSLAVIQELKRRRPEIVTVIGGANCESEMGEEVVARYPDVDFVGRGECEHTLVELVRKLQAGESGVGSQGFLSKHDTSPTQPSPPLMSEQLDALPHPELSDFFEQLDGTTYRQHVYPGIAMETSRGCWWGMKHHCTFCGFNREGMVYRSKSPERALGEMSALAKKHGLDRLELTDNILDSKYLMTLVPKLAKDPVAEVFCETKSNFTRQHIETMSKAKIRWIQPGLESLSDTALELMRKGTTQLQNVQTLKWAMEGGIRITWNWLHGFPGEEDAEVDELARTVEALHHLQPPGCCVVLFLERFSPYFMTPEQWNLTNVRPTDAYAHVYPFPPESLHRLAFFFETDYLQEKEKGEAHAKLSRVVARWQAVHAESHFIGVPTRNALVLIDTRPAAKRFVRRLTGLRRRIYEFCDRTRPEDKIIQVFRDEASADEVKAILRAFVDDLLVLERNGRYVSLAADPRGEYRRYPAVFPGGQLLPLHKLRQKPRWGRLRRVADVATLRIPPGTVYRRAKSKARLAAMNKLVSLLTRPGWAPPAEQAEQPVGLSPNAAEESAERPSAV